MRSVVACTWILLWAAVAPTRAGEPQPGGQSPLRFAAAARPPELVEPVPPTDPVEPSAVLALEHIEQVALANNPAVGQAEARWRAAQGAWLQAGLPPNPVIGYQGEEMGADGTAGQQGGFIGQQFVTGGKLRLAREVAGARILEAEQQLAAARFRVQSDVRSAYYNALAAQRRLALARQLVGIGEQGISAADELLKAQEVGRIDVIQAGIEADEARIQLQSAENRVRSAWQVLATVAGMPDWRPQPLEDTLERQVPRLQWNDVVARLLSASPEIALAMARVDRAGWTLEKELAECKPNVDVQVGVQRDNTSGDTISGVELSLPVPIMNRNQGGIRRAEAEMAAARHAVRRVELDLQRRLADVFRRYADAHFRSEKYARDILPGARDSLDLVTRGYRQGEIGYLALLTAQRTYFQTNLSYIEALDELWQAALRIDGMLLEGSLADDPPSP